MKTESENFEDIFFATFRRFMTTEDFFNRLFDVFYAELPEKPTEQDVKYFNEHKEGNQNR
jgi:hypothetical protein